MEIFTNECVRFSHALIFNFFDNLYDMEKLYTQLIFIHRVVLPHFLILILAKTYYILYIISLLLSLEFSAQVLLLPLLIIAYFSVTKIL